MFIKNNDGQRFGMAILVFIMCETSLNADIVISLYI